MTGRLAHAHYRAGSSTDALGPLAGLAGADPPPAADAASPGALAQLDGQLMLLYAQGAYDKIVATGRALARAGRTAGNRQMHAAGTRTEGAGLISLGRLAEGAELIAATLPADLATAGSRTVDNAVMLSAAYLGMGLPDRCQAVSEPMLIAAERVGDQVAAVMHTVMLAGACYVRGDWHRGRDLVERAQRFAAGSSPRVVRAAGVLAPVLIWHGAWDQAREYLDGCLRSARSLRIAEVERLALAYLAELDVLDGRPRDALTRLQPVTAGRPPPATEDLTWSYAVHLLSVLAGAELELGDLPRARAYAQRAVKQVRRMGTWVQGIRALEVHGMIEMRDGHYDLALAAYTEGLHRAEAMPFPYAQARLLHAHALLDRRQRDHAAARAKFAQALAILENLGAGQDTARVRQVMAATAPAGNPSSG